MGLVYWLPMITDALVNQGLSNAVPINKNSTVYANGKLGKCRSFAGTSYQAIDTGYKESFESGDFSISVWFYLIKNTSLIYQPIITNKTTAAASVGVGLYFNKSQMKFLWSTADGSSATEVWMATALTEDFIYDKWHHIVMVRENADAKKGFFYIDGTRYELTGVPAIRNVTNTSTNFCIGGMPSDYSKYRWSGYLNDLRIYDTALSAREVKEISKGLILHYPLSRGGFGQDNFLQHTATMPVHTSSFKGFRASGGTVSHIDYSDCPVGTGVIRITNTGSAATNVGMAQDSISGFVAGQRYSQSCYVRCSTTVSTCYLQPIWISSSQHTEGMTERFTIGTDWQYIKFEGTILNGDQATSYSSGYIYANIPAGAWFEVCGMKVEEGSVATPWTPNSTDAEYAAMGLDNNIEYDCSGFGNNGEKINALTYTSDTPRYNVSTHIGATNQKIHVSGLATTGFENSYSFAWWAKISSVTPMHWGFSDGIRLNGMYTGHLWNTGDSSNNPLYNPGTITQVTDPTVGVWHHWVMTGDGTKCRVYQDGVLWAEAKTYKSISGTSIYINGWDSGTSYCSNDLSISDFRIYATALSADDVLALYNTPVSIADNGVMMVQGELSEV